MEKKKGFFEFFSTLISAAASASAGTMIAQTYNFGWAMLGLTVIVLFLACYGAARFIRSRFFAPA